MRVRITACLEAPLGNEPHRNRACLQAGRRDRLHEVNQRRRDVFPGCHILRDGLQRDNFPADNPAVRNTVHLLREAAVRLLLGRTCGRGTDVRRHVHQFRCEADGDQRGGG